MQQRTLRFFPIALCFLLLLAGCGKKDKSTRYITKDAVGVVSFNAGQLLKKVGMNVIAGSPMFEEMMKKAGKDTAAFDFDKLGIDYMSIVYAYAVADQRLAGKSRFMLIIPVKDADKFAATLKEHFKEAKFETKDKLSFAQLNDAMSIGWDKSTAIMAVATPATQWSDAGATNANNNTLLTEEIQKAFGLSEEQSINSNKQFSDLVKEGHDIGFWLNYEAMVNSMPQEQLGSAGAIMASQKKLIKDAFVAAGMDFEKGKIVGEAKYYFNPSMKAVAEALQAKSASDELLKKVPGSQLNLMMSYHFNPQGIKTALDTMGVLPLANAGLKEFGMTIDEVLSAFSGDILLAVTDFSVATESQSYTLAGSSVSYTKPVPSFKASLSFKLNDKAAFDKLAQIAVSNQVITPSGPGVYTIGSITLVTDGKYAVASNEAAVANAFLQSPGNAAFNNVPSEVKNSTSGFFVDIKNSIKTVPLDLLYGKQDTTVFHDGKNLLESISTYGGKVKDNYADFHFEATFVNKEENSLVQLIRFVQKVKDAESKEGDSFDEVAPEADSTQEEIMDSAAVEAI